MKTLGTALSTSGTAWAVLLFGLGNVGGVAAAFVISLLGSAAARFEARNVCRLVGWALLGLVAMSWVIAPVLIGELEIVHGGQVFLVLSVLGLVPLAIGLGGLLPERSRARRRAVPLR